MTDYYLEVKEIVKTYPGVVALDDVFFQQELGKIHALIGENGAGKSTLIKILAGAITPSSGKIIIDHKSFDHMTAPLAQKLGIGVIYQELNLMPALSVTENIFIGKEITRFGLVNKREMTKKAKEIFAEMGVDIDVNVKVGSLTLAYQQLVEIAKAISRELKILIMDEPTSSLSVHETERMFKVVNSLKKQGIGVIYITHRLEELNNFADCITVLRDGKHIKTVPASAVTHDELIEMMIGRDLSTNYYPNRKDVSFGKVVLEVKHLHVQNYVKNVSFSVSKGEIVGLAGLVGSGRTTTARGIFGADKKESGEILLNGKRLDIKKPFDAIKSGIVMVPEDRKLHGVFLLMSVKHNLTFPSINLDQITKMGIISGAAEKKITSKQIKSLNIRTPHENQKALLLSGGNQQKLSVGKWLTTEPCVFIFDEPTRGIDVGAKHEIYEIIDTMARQGAAIIIISSELPELIGLSDKVVAMYEGRVTGIIKRNEVTQEKVMRYCSGITA